MITISYEGAPTDTEAIDAIIDAYVRAEIERAETQAKQTVLDAAACFAEALAAHAIGEHGYAADRAGDGAVCVAAAAALEGAIAVTRARLAVSRFVAGIRGRHG